MRVFKPLDRWDLSIKKKEYVLEVGSGHNPCSRSNVIVEKYLSDNSNRCGDVKIYANQKFINADGENLPFQDKEFDYVICNQVLEHVEHPEIFIRELVRVAKRGYIETPSLLGEFLFPKTSHKWVILDIDNKLIFFDKLKMPGNYKNDYGELFLNYLPYQSLPYKILGLMEGDLMMNRYEWRDNIDFIVNPQDEYYLTFFMQKWTPAMVRKLFPERSLKNELSKIVRAGIHLIQQKISWKLKKRPALLTIEEYLKQNTF